MLVDIGTNTEVVVTDGTRFLAASCPAGPAFEGGLVRFGMPGADGAIETLRIDDDRFVWSHDRRRARRRGSAGRGSSTCWPSCAGRAG